MGQHQGSTVDPPEGYVRLAGSERRPRPGARLLGPADPGATLTVTVRVRRRPGSPPLPGHAHWMATPPGKRKFLTTEQLTATYGAAAEDLERVARFAAHHHLAVRESDPTCRTVLLSGTVEHMSRAFAVELGRYELAEETYRGRDGFVHVPRDLHGVVLGVFGLDNRRVGSRNGVGDPAGTSALFGGPTAVTPLYNFPPVPAGITSQRIGVIEMGGGWTASDISTSLANWGVSTSPTPIDVPVTGAERTPRRRRPGQRGHPRHLRRRAVAPGAIIQVYWGLGLTAPSPGVDWLAVVNRIVSPKTTGPHPDPPRPSVVTTSDVLAAGDDASTLAFFEVSQAQVTEISAAFQELAALGVTVFVASGDDGARSRTTDGKVHVQYPGSDPWVTSCGGTTISLSPSAEWVWNDVSPNDGATPQATGGGVSAFPWAPSAVPAWQVGVVTQTILNTTTTGRGVPDVAGNASLQSGYYLPVDGNTAPGSSSVLFCGTSAVSPLYAGLMAIVNATLGQSVGFLNPTLYALRSTVCRDINDQQYAGSPPDNGVPAFDDPNTGKNYPAVQGYRSGPGWDACTGLGVIDGGALLAALQAEFHRDCQVVVDRSEIGQDEVAAAIEQASPGVISNVLYVMVDGFKPTTDLGIHTSDLTGTPTVVPSFSYAPSLASLTIEAVQLLAVDVGADGSLLDFPQRLTWVCSASFTDSTTGFGSAPLPVTVQASIGGLSGSGVVTLVLNADPYLLDGPVSWLSNDVRVFQLATHKSIAGSSVVLQNTGMPPVDAPTYIGSLIDELRANTTPPPNHPFDQISTDEQISEVTIASEDATGVPVYNFALARVRYQSESASDQVRVFFRLFQAATTSTAYDPDTYSAYASGGTNGFKTPLFGVVGGDVVAVPCFAAARDPIGTPLSQQIDAKNVLANIQPGPGGAPVYTYFGCWLDINQSTPNVVPTGSSVPTQFSGALTVAGTESMLSYVRGVHQCVVAEVSYDDDPVVAGQTPASSDKLAQRNLSIVASANPGDLASHRIPLTFDVRPTPAALPADGTPDELMITWGSTPLDSYATLYLPAVDASAVLAMATTMYANHRIVRVDDHTLGFPVGGVTYVPVPRGAGANFAGLLSIDLPATVRKGQSFGVVLHQVTDSTRAAPDQRSQLRGEGRGGRRILSSFQLTIPVDHKEVLLEPEERTLSVMRWIGERIQTGDRWAPVFARYLAQLTDRVQALGGDPGLVLPSPTGNSPPPKAPPHGHPPHGHAPREAVTGKIVGLTYDRFGDFEGFLLETKAGEERSFESTESEVEALVHRAWVDRILLTVFVDRHRPERVQSIVLRRAPRPV